MRSLTRRVDANICYSYDYLFQLAVEMRKLGLPWISDVKPVDLKRNQ